MLTGFRRSPSYNGNNILLFLSEKNSQPWHHLETLYRSSRNTSHPTPPPNISHQTKTPLTKQQAEPIINEVVSYIASVGVGASNSQYQAIADTGSSNTWVGATKNLLSTSTSANTGARISASYASGSFSGTEWTNTVTLSSSLVVTKQRISVASTSSGFSGTDGILGIGPIDLTKSTKVIGISFESTTSEEVINGETLFGGTDSAKFTGSVTYIFELDHNPFTLTLPDTATNFSLIREIASLQSARFSQVSLYKPHEHYGAGESEKLRQKLLESKTPAELGMLLDSTETPLLPILKSLPHARSATITALIAVIWSPDQMVDLKRKLDDVDSGPDDMHEMAKKKFHALVNDPTSSPSVSAQPTNYYQYQTRPTALVDGRYSNDASKVAAAPIEFFHPVFAAFLGYLKDNERIDPELLRNTHEMMHSASQIATAEHQRERKTQAHLAKILNKGVGQISVYNKGTPDHSVTFTCEGFPLGVALLAALEEKGELGTSGDPVTQVAFSYLTYWKCFGQTELRNACCCPSFLISLAGPWITISGAIFAESVVVQRLTDLICLENGRDQDDEKVFAVARVFRALVWAVSDLKDWYINHRADLTPGTRSLSLPEERFFPLANSYTAADGITVSFKYLNWLKAPSPTCRVFLAVRSDNEEKVVVKFVERYGEIAHKQLAKAGLAPKLLYCGSIWKETTQQLGMGKRKMVVMEYIEGKHPHGGVSDSVRDAIANAIQGLHQNGLVHGDIRLPNIIIQDSDQSNPNLDEAKRVRILDFDWAGKDGEVRYPLGLVMDGRPVDAVEDSPICTFHDHAMIEALKALQPIKQE
ncbi:hypothetical protein D9757_012969 [Collybiopsis confluens]|uniref:Peptidase A1 domain-containing protein n=1 Tax=Collybiopsis confluens TaxID=2823264 RepID=A0A8H5G594_9AGAR|nr:hypothetical protein D9757_011604 [Collybiopsis confluens]KAF5358573.1 hypothetical protein D9757_012969 [Collybiopsis confluens]